MSSAASSPSLAMSLLYAGEPDRVPEGEGWSAQLPEPVDAVALSELQPNELWRIDDVHELLSSLTYEVRMELAGGAELPVRERLAAVGALLEPVLPEAPRGCGGSCMCGAGGGGCGAAGADEGADPVANEAAPDATQEAGIQAPQEPVTPREPSETLRAVRMLWSGEVVPVDSLAAMAGQGEGWTDKLGYLVRHFMVQGDGGVVVDTVGLEGHGLPDLQLHTTEIASTDAIAIVDALARRLLADGDPGDGGTLADDSDDEWTVDYAGALAPPSREVLDLSR